MGRGVPVRLSGFFSPDEMNTFSYITLFLHYESFINLVNSRQISMFNISQKRSLGARVKLKFFCVSLKDIKPHYGGNIHDILS